MSATRFAASILVVLLIAPFASTAPNASLATVAGNVFVDGKPLQQGRVFFHIDNGQFVGSKIKDGAYKVEHVPVGVLKVTVESEKVPAKYSDEANTQLRFECKKGENALDFDLKSK